MRLDHVILAAADLDAAARRIERDYDLRATPGGRHEGLGTENRIVPLGGGYLELLAVADPAEAAGSELGRAVARRLRESGDGLIGWAVAVDDVDAVARRLGTRVSSISRRGLTARLTGVTEAMAEPCLPFFISRDEGVPDPGFGSDAGGLSWVEVAGDAGRIRAWLGDDALPVRIVEGPAALRAAGVGERVVR